MAKKNSPASAQSKEDYTPIGSKGFGGKAVNIARVASGIKLELDTDSEMFGRYVGMKDITDKVTDHDESKGPVVYHTFFDGKRLVTISSSYAIREMQEKAPFVQGNYYYILNEGEVKSKFPNPMKDFTIINLGTGKDDKGNPESIQVPERVDKSGAVTLSDDEIKRLNYTVINYPLK